MSTERRSTRQRAALIEALGTSLRFRSAQEIHADLRDAGSPIGLATVYRNLQNLAADGEVDQVRAEDGEVRYRACGSGHHHHHLVCRGCGRTIELTAPDVERWSEALGAEHGFTNVQHTLEVTGTCARCS
ncbi:MAG: transcriptional repressor [Tetrasphaera sp.]|nr:transcriptional repressor [Tetrasphaera sp.]